MEQKAPPKTRKFVLDGLIWLFFTVLTSTAVYMMATVPSETFAG